MKSYQNIDSLGFFSIVLNLYYLLHWSLNYYTGDNYLIVNFYIPQALVALSLIGFLNPKSIALLLLNSLVFCAYYLTYSPISSNNQTTAFFLSALVATSLLISLLKQKKGSLDRNDIQELIRGPGKLILVCMYIFGIYHKLNTDFFDPTVSCAVELYKPIAAIIGQENNQIGHWVAIYLTFLIEGIAILGLLTNRYRKIGIALGVPFHIIIGFTGYAFYMDFSTIVLAMYTLSITDDSMHKINTAFHKHVKSTYARTTISYLPALVALLILSHVAACDGVCSGQTFMPIFAAYSIPIYFILLFSKVNKHRVFTYSGSLYLIPFAFFLNGLSPYLGLKTESAIAMFSNLHVEGLSTNHFIHGVIPGFANYSDEIIKVIESNQPELPKGSQLVRYDFDRRLAILNEVELTVTSNMLVTGQATIVSSESWVNTYESTNWLIKKFLVFKPVDTSNPKVCTH